MPRCAITVAQAREMIAKGQTRVVVDVRDAPEGVEKSGKVVGAVKVSPEAGVSRRSRLSPLPRHEQEFCEG